MQYRLLIPLLLVYSSLTYGYSPANIKLTVNLYTEEEQRANHERAKAECEIAILAHTSKKNYTINGTEPARCPMDFDGISCWPESQANATVNITCPSYINLFNYSEIVVSFCQADGTWLLKDNLKRYVNYNRCKVDLSKYAPILDLEPDIIPNISPFVKEHLRWIQLVYTIGYSVSLISLVVALVIMISLRSLHCPRNTIHMNMFVSFILRGGITLLHDYLIAHNTTTVNFENGITESTENNWTCKLLTSVWMYTRLSNYTWIFIEGLYLHILIFINTFSDNSGIKWLILGGWGSPFLFLIPWVLVRLEVDDFQCWTVYKDRNYRWIIEAPIMLLIVANFIFFIIIMKLLLTKLKASESSSREMRVYRYLKLAKSTLVLIPLFGLHYMVFLFVEIKGVDQSSTNDTLNVVRFYFDTSFTSFQGLMVGILFCFLNGEVRTEIYRKWHRWRSQHVPVQSQLATVTTGRTASFSSDVESLAPPKSLSRHSSIPLTPAIPEETRFLLTCDDNQNNLSAEEVCLMRKQSMDSNETGRN